MSVCFILRTRKTEGRAPLVARIQSPKLGVNILSTTTIDVDIVKYTASPKGKLHTIYMKTEEGMRIKTLTAQITAAVDNLLRQGVKITPEQARTLIDDIVLKEEKEEALRREEERKRKEAEAKRMTLNKFVDLYQDQITTGVRQTDKGTNYAPSTIKAVKQALNQFKYFQEDTGQTYDFNDIDMQFYYDFTAYLKNKKYAVNSIGKCIKELKYILYVAESEGHHTNNKWKDKKFKGTRVDVDNIYLTKEELDKIMAADLSKFGIGHQQARDIFMVGVWTAQRVSDYNNISRDNFNTLTKKVIVEVPDPDNPGKTKSEIREEEITYLNICQQKTGAKVSIPCNSALKAILEKYDYQMPHLEDQVINRYIKEVAEAAGITDMVEIETTKGGTPLKTKVRRCDLIRTHTARRTGATLMYLAGIDIYDIMKVTGHTSPTTLRKYIKAENLKVVEKLTDKYEYFR